MKIKGNVHGDAVKGDKKVYSPDSEEEHKKPFVFRKWQFWAILIVAALLTAGVITWDQLLELLELIF